MKFIHIPNEIRREERILNTVFSVLLFAYGSFGVWVNDLYIPGKRSPAASISTTFRLGSCMGQ